jgi:hypothetical protein
MNRPHAPDESLQARWRKRTRAMLYVVFSWIPFVVEHFSFPLPHFQFFCFCCHREERLLRNALNEHNGNDSCIDRSRIQRQANAIEALLFKHQPSFDAAASIEDNDDRVTNQELNRTLIMLMGKIVEHRRCRFTCGENGSACSVINVPCAPGRVLVLDARQEALEACMGKDRYRQANAILGTIQQLGVDLTGQCYTRRPGRFSLPYGTMPKPVRRLFCETSLRTIMDRTPIAQLYLQDWDKLLTQAERHLKDYLEWLAQSRKEEQTAASGASSCGCRTKAGGGKAEEA